MAEIIRMPRLSDTMEEGNIVGWLKSVGDQVEPGDILAEVETDKATMELESFQSGTLLYIGQEEGTVPVDGIIAIIGEKGEDYKAQLKEAQASGGPSATKEEVKEEMKEEAPATPAPAPAASSQAKSTPAPAASKPVQSENGGRVKASPLAKSMASDAGFNIESIPGTGEGGRIIKKDVEDFIASGGAQAAPAAGSSAPMISLENDVQYGDVPVTQMRKVIARRLGESKFTAPHFYLTVEINMDAATAARNDLKKSEIRVSFNDFVVKASAMALKKHPSINSSWHGDKITVHPYVNIGVAVAVPDGLLVPVINNADQKSMTYINQEVRTLAGKAKEKKLQPAEMSGNTFTISNLGMFGIEEFTAIINSPDSCILAVGSIIQKPIVKDGQIVIGNMMKVTLSCDHRTVDGMSGAMFLETLKGMLENPVRMLV
ncbi:MAG: pyruvate dehydrogenase E2 component (dihydrolipoamide acetyltransferase) [Saprospiraceae bacterium]|jgi:pyruvate dehydrogenase E2 component (dihydrolipoamide acetyltransferase)|tara:strand:- start:289 stop:1581 length:1293 start_codon:yes stop_codon:yes gene_type:complete